MGPAPDASASERPDLRIAAALDEELDPHPGRTAARVDDVCGDIDPSVYTAKRYPRPLIDYLRGHGKEKVLFGTHYPMIPPAKALGGLDELELTDEVASLFLSENAKRVFQL